MKLTKKVLALFLSTTLTISLAACGSSDENVGASTDSGTDTSTATVSGSDTTDSETKEATQDLEPMDISVAIWGIQDAFDNANAANDTIFNDLCKKFNVTITPVQVTWNDYKDKNKVWAASGTLPDVFCDANVTDNFGLYKTWAEQGIIKEIPSDLSNYPNLEKLFSLDSVKALAMAERYYMVPRGGDLSVSISEASGMSRWIMYRKDWAAAAGFTQAPATYDEMLKMIKAMMAQHSNAVGIAINNDEYLQALALDVFPELSTYSSWIKENNKWIPAYASEKTVPYIERLQKLYSDGILDPDFITQKDGDGLGKFVSGNACVMFGGNFKSQISTFMDSNADVKNLSDAIGFIYPFATEDGNTYQFSAVPFWSETYMNAQIDDAKEQRILMMLDYMYSHEYASLYNNGIEGVDWEKTDAGNVSLLKDQTLTDKYPITQEFGCLASWMTGFSQSSDAVINADANVAAYDKIYKEAYDYYNSSVKVIPYNYQVMLMDNAEKINISSLTSDFKTYLDKAIIDNGDAKEAWAAMIKDFNTKKLQEAITSVTKQADDLGIEQ